MSGLLLCGKTADKPFTIKEGDISLYSMEELCYYLYNNVYMIGPEFFNENLLEFLEKELGLEKVVKKLKDQIYRNESYISMIQTILEGSYYYTESEKEIIGNVLNELGSKSISERIKTRADMLAEKGRYESAIKSYRLLLGKNYRITDNRLLGSIWNNMGVIYARLFLYEDAAACFKLACDLYKNQEFTDNLVCSAILAEAGNSNGKTILEDIKIQYEISGETVERYEKAIDMARNSVEEDTEIMKDCQMLEYSQDKELASYYRDIDVILNQWKKEYREQKQ